MKYISESVHFLPTHLPLPPVFFFFFLFVEICPQAPWSVFPFANPPTMVHMSFWGVPHALHSMTVSFWLISQSPLPASSRGPHSQAGREQRLKGQDSAKNYWMGQSVVSDHAFQQAHWNKCSEEQGGPRGDTKFSQSGLLGHGLEG